MDGESWREVRAGFLALENSLFDLEANLPETIAPDVATMLDRAVSALNRAIKMAIQAPYRSSARNRFRRPDRRRRNLSPYRLRSPDSTHDHVYELTRNVCRLARQVDTGAYICRWLIVATGREQLLSPQERARDQRQRQQHVAAFRTLAAAAARLAGLVKVGASDDEAVDVWLDYVREAAPTFVNHTHGMLEHLAKASASVWLTFQRTLRQAVRTDTRTPGKQLRTLMDDARWGAKELAAATIGHPRLKAGLPQRTIEALLANDRTMNRNTQKVLEDTLTAELGYKCELTVPRHPRKRIGQTSVKRR